MALGNVLRSRKRFDDAAATYTKAVERIGTPDRGHWILFFYRGTSYERAKQWDKAQADLKKALELVPETQPGGRAQVMNYLAYSWVDRGENIDDAFKMLQRAVELAPRDGMIIDSLGWAYYRLGRYDDAVRELEKAVDLKAGDPVINDHLGDAYWKVGRKLEARFQWNHAKDSNPEHEDLDQDPREDRQRHGRVRACRGRERAAGQPTVGRGEERRLDFWHRVEIRRTSCCVTRGVPFIPRCCEAWTFPCLSPSSNALPPRSI